MRSGPSSLRRRKKNRDPDDPADDRNGDARDHTPIEAESRSVLCVASGKPMAENVVAVVGGVKRRTEADCWI